MSVAQTEQLLALIKKEDKMLLIAFSEDLLHMRELAAFRGANGCIILAIDDGILVSIDSSLILFKNQSVETILKTSSERNFFWHATKFGETIIVQEYGLSGLTSIYSSRDLLRWQKCVSNLDIDRYSLHFHDVAYDRYRNQLITTLGDGNYNRAACSSDGGLNWRILFQGAWQFLPIVPLRHSIVFGMDSGLARGGVGIYDPVKNTWQLIFLRWVKANIRLAQMCDLKRLENGLWIASLGTPQAIVVSQDLAKWFPLYVEGFNSTFSHCMKIAEGKTCILCSTGRHLLVFEKRELTRIENDMQPALIRYRACKHKLLGLGFVLKRKIQNLAA